MVRKKKLSPSGAKDDDGEYHNVHVNIHEDELAVAGMSIGDEVFVRVRDGKIIIQKADPDDVEHDFQSRIGRPIEARADKDRCGPRYLSTLADAIGQ